MLAIAAAGLRPDASLAQAELTARGDLFVKFSGGIAPNALPRDARAPISVSVAGTVRTLSGERPPALRRDLDRDQPRRPARRPGPAGLPPAPRSNRPRPRKPSRRLRPGAGRRRQLRGRRRLPRTVGLSRRTVASSPSTPSSTASARSSPTSTSAEPAADHPHHRLPHPRTRRHLRHGPHRLAAGGGRTATATSKRISLTSAPRLHLPRPARSYLSAACAAPGRLPRRRPSPSPAPRWLRRRPHPSSILTRSCKVRGWLSARRRDPRDRPGDHRHDLPRLRRRGPGRRPRLLGVRAALPAAGLGRARRRRDLGGDAAGRRARRSPTPASTGAELDGIGITNQRETVVAWDPASGEPIHRALVWQDRRTAERCDELRAAGQEALVRERTGLTIDPYFSGDQDRVAAAQRRGRRAGGLRHDRLLARSSS